jgi:hypothetical protein
MVARTYGVCLLSFSLLNLSVPGRFWPKLPRFFSLFSATLLSFQEATSNEIKDLRGGGLQTEIGGL